MTKMSILCSGQGSQYVGMGRDLCAERVVAATFDEASDALSLDMKQLCFESPSAELAKTMNTQPAVMTYSMALFRLFSERHEITPDVVAGHSLGELTALSIAGALPFRDALRLARSRGEFMQQVVPEGRGMMLAVRTRDVERVERLCEKIRQEQHLTLSISNYNSNSQTVISGEREAVLAAVEVFEAEDISAIPLNVSVPFHCELLEPVADLLKSELEAITIGELNIPVLSNVTGKLYSNSADVIELLTRQVSAPVRWVDIQKYLRLNGFTWAVEVGPGSTLTKFMRATHADIHTFAYDTDEGRSDVERMAARMTFPFVPRALGMAVSTRNTNFDESAYQAGVIEPCKQMHKIAKQIEKEDRSPRTEELHLVLALLLKVFKTKGVPGTEQQSRVDELIRDTGTAATFVATDSMV